MGAVEAAALAYAERGLRIVPLYVPQDGGCSCRNGAKCNAPGKHPRLLRWPEYATTDANQIRQWWKRWPESNVGIVTGRKSGIVALDVDVDHGGDDELAELEASYRQLPTTPEVITGSGGRHVLFAAPDVALGNSAGSLGDGLDIRAEGGLIVAPPSTHASGRRYEWEVSAHLDDVELSPVPDWLLGLLRLARQRDGRQPVILEGERHTGLTRLAGRLRLSGLDPEAMRPALHEHNARRCRPPLDRSEVDAIADSAAKWTEPPAWLASPFEFMRDPALGSDARLLLMVLALHADPEGIARPGYRRIGDLTGLSQKAIRPLLDELEDADRLKVVRRNKRLGNVYRVAPVLPEVEAEQRNKGLLEPNSANLSRTSDPPGALVNDQEQRSTRGAVAVG